MNPILISLIAFCIIGSLTICINCKAKKEFWKQFINVISVLITSIFGLVVALHFDRIEKDKNDKEEFQKYISICFTDIENSKKNISFFQDMIINKKDTLFFNALEKNMLHYERPKVLMNFLGNSFFIRNITSEEVRQFSTGIDLLNDIYNTMSDFGGKIENNINELSFIYSDCLSRLHFVERILIDGIYFKEGLISKEELNLLLIFELSGEGINSKYINVTMKMKMIDIFNSKKNIDKVEKYFPENKAFRNNVKNVIKTLSNPYNEVLKKKYGSPITGTWKNAIVPGSNL